MPHPESHIIATWSDKGHVSIHDISTHVKALDTPGLSASKTLSPMHVIKEHKGTEGYALDWSRNQMGHLISGDVCGKIFLTTKTPSGFVTESTPFTSHTSSVEDLQFSHVQSNVFASSSADRTIKIWDTRTRNKAQLSVKAHDSDVNVIGWNRYVHFFFSHTARWT